MVTQISEGIQISVETFFQEGQSNPLANEYVFAYRITIQNHNRFAIRLKSRIWYIFDSNWQRREVEGEGVVGQQPVLEPGNSFQYVSGCNFSTEMGKMTGYYQMENQNDKSIFEVKIPMFEMIAPSKLN